jgi:hypothetical protein
VSLTAKFVPVGIGLATVALALGCTLGGLWFVAVPILILGVAWLVGQSRGWPWIASLGLALSTVAAAAGLLLGLGAGWMLAGLVAALAVWDLYHFSHALESVPRVEGERSLERRHLQRLLMAVGLGVLLAAVALGVRVSLGFGLVLLLGLVAILGLSQAVAFLRTESD